MNQKMKSGMVTVALVLGLLLTSNALAQSNVQLEWKFEPGTQLEVTMVQDVVNTNVVGGQTMETSNTTNSWMTWNVTEVNDEGVATITNVIERMVMDISSPMGAIKFDSDKETQDDAQGNNIAQVIQPLIGAELVQKMKPSGEIVDVHIPEDVKGALDSGGPGMGDMIENVSKNATLEFPDEPLTVGKSWQNEMTTSTPTGDMNLVTTYTYQGVKEVDSKPLHHFDVDVKMSFAGDMINITEQSTKGNMYFDAEAGRIDHSKVEQDVKMMISAGGQEVESSLKQIATLKFEPKE